MPQADSAQLWSCPLCGRSYSLVDPANSPTLCPNCDPTRPRAASSSRPAGGERRSTVRYSLVLGLVLIAAGGGVYFGRGIVAPSVPATDLHRATETAAEANSTPAAGDTEAVAVGTAEVLRQVDAGVVEVQGDDALGSGFFVGDRRTVCTNYHVVEGQAALSVKTADGTMVRVAGWLAVEPRHDLALLRVARATPETEPLEIAARPPERGENVFALGSPLGLTGSVSAGIVSAIRTTDDFRSILSQAEYGRGNYAPDAVWVQTTAPISPGNSGGPLVNEHGAVMAINTLAINALETNTLELEGQNLNFAISSRHVAEMMPAAEGKVRPLSELPRRPALVVARTKEAPTRERAPAASAVAAIERQRELDRVHQRILQLRGEIALIDSEGRGVVAERSRVVAAGRAVGVAIARTNAQIVQSQLRLVALAEAISRRQVYLNGGLVVLDNENAAFNEIGILQLQNEQALIQIGLATLAGETKGLEANYVALDQQAKGLFAQIAAYEIGHVRKATELQALEQKHASLQKPAPD